MGRIDQAEALRYGVEMSRNGASRLAVHVPAVVWQVIADQEPVGGHVRQLVEDRMIDVDDSHQVDGKRLAINDQRIGELDIKNKTVSKLSHVLSGLHVVGQALEMLDPRMTAKLTVNPPVEGGYLTPEFRLLWPDVTDHELETVATGHMRYAAGKLRYGTRYGAAQVISAHIERDHFGIRLTVGDHLGIEVNTTQRPYRPGQPAVELRAANLKSQQEQLIALAGVVAIAHAEELV